MTITVNGQKRDIEAGTTMQQLLEKLNLQGKVMAAAVNMNIVKQDSWDKHALQDGDKLELLDFVGGG